MKTTLLTTLLAVAALSATAQDQISGTPISTPADQFHPVEMLFDGDPATYFATRAIAQHVQDQDYTEDKHQYAWGGMDFGEPYVISKIEYTVANTSTGADRTLLGTFQAANDPEFLDAVTLHIIGQKPQRAQTVSVDVDCTKGFRYVRYVGPAQSRCNMAELKFYGTAGEGTDAHYPTLTGIPVVTITTKDNVEPYDKVNAIVCKVTIVDTDGSLNISADAGVRERGNASRGFPKRPWRIKFDKKQRPLDAPAKAKKWTLINNYGDKTLFRNMLAFDIARKLDMAYVPWARLVDVVLNGEYKGTYQLTDQIEINSNRVNITEMTPEDVDGDALTGGYLVEVDAYAYNEQSYFVTNHYYLPVTIHSPDEDEILPAQSEYIEDYFNSVENHMYDNNPQTGYRSLFDVDSFLQHMLTGELAANTDTYWSTYMYKDRGGMLYTGPVWDFDLGFENDQRTYPVTEKTRYNWLWDSDGASAAGNMKWFAERIVFHDPQTAYDLLRIWSKARVENGMTYEWFSARIDEYATQIAGSQRLNFLRWPILNSRVHQNPVALGSFSAEVERVRNFLRTNLENIDGLCGFSMSGVQSVGADADAWTLYSIDGTVMASGRGTPSTAGLGKGIYLVRTAKGTRKIVL